MGFFAEWRARRADDGGSTGIAIHFHWPPASSQKSGLRFSRSDLELQYSTVSSSCTSDFQASFECLGCPTLVLIACMTLKSILLSLKHQHPFLFTIELRIPLLCRRDRDFHLHLHWNLHLHLPAASSIKAKFLVQINACHTELPKLQ